jgi:hypothetical protein
MLSKLVERSSPSGQVHEEQESYEVEDENEDENEDDKP